MAKTNTTAQASKSTQGAISKNGKTNPKAPAKSGKAQGAAKKTKRDIHAKLSTGTKTRAAMLHLLKVGATSPDNAFPREEMHAKVAGTAVTIHLIRTGHVEVTVEEDKSRSLYLTAKGKKVAEQFKKEASKPAPAAAGK